MLKQMLSRVGAPAKASGEFIVQRAEKLIRQANPNTADNLHDICKQISDTNSEVWRVGENEPWNQAHVVFWTRVKVIHRALGGGWLGWLLFGFVVLWIGLPTVWPITLPLLGLTWKKLYSMTNESWRLAKQMEQKLSELEKKKGPNESLSFQNWLALKENGLI